MPCRERKKKRGKGRKERGKKKKRKEEERREKKLNTINIAYRERERGETLRADSAHLVTRRSTLGDKQNVSVST